MNLRKLTKNKRAEGIFGMSFGMIFTIILIVFFIAGAFVAIKTFLNWQKTIQIGLFFDDLQNEIDVAWNANSYGPNWFNSTLPNGIEYVCFVNLTSSLKEANNIETNIFEYMKTGYYETSKNLYLYSPTKNYGMNWRTLKHIDLSGRNPKCAKVINNIVSIRIERKFEDKLVRVSA